MEVAKFPLLLLASGINGLNVILSPVKNVKVGVQLEGNILFVLHTSTVSGNFMNVALIVFPFLILFSYSNC